MPSLFVVITTSDTPRLYVTQKDYAETLRSLRAWPYSHTRRAFVFEPRAIPNVGANPQGDPSNHMQLALTGVIEPTDAVENYQYLWGSELDRLPHEQQVLRAQQAVDYISKKLTQLENKNTVAEVEP